MPRPRICRRVMSEPNIVCFKPAGVTGGKLEKVILTVDEFESVRLKDLEGMEQEECAEKMDISQPTFYRLLSSAHRKIADAIINGKMLRIEGGNFKMYGKAHGRHEHGNGHHHEHGYEHMHAHEHNEI